MQGLSTPSSCTRLAPGVSPSRSDRQRACTYLPNNQPKLLSAQLDIDEAGWLAAFDRQVAGAGSPGGKAPCGGAIALAAGHENQPRLALMAIVGPVRIVLEGCLDDLVGGANSVQRRVEAAAGQISDLDHSSPGVADAQHAGPTDRHVDGIAFGVP